jgi:hypothetical protein
MAIASTNISFLYFLEKDYKNSDKYASEMISERLRNATWKLLVSPLIASKLFTI